MNTLLIVLLVIFWFMTAYLAFKGGYKFGVSTGISIAISYSKNNGEVDKEEVAKMTLETLGIIKEKK